PSAGPSYGRAMDQAALLARYSFPCVMMLPCGDPRDAKGLERGYRQFAAAAQSKLIIYLKDESNFGSNREAGLDAVARLVNDGVCIGIKYAVVRQDPSVDTYLDALLTRVHRTKVISGIGERPAIQHLRDFHLPGFTTGSGCLAPNQSRLLFERITSGDFASAAELRQQFLAVEDLRDAWGPARVLHAATALAGVAETGPIAPYISGLEAAALQQLKPVAELLVASDAKAAPVTV
ncbi:MAG: dihydrodipicolinate synthase family protein, partial [Acidobacteriia bacterium]|nr:dihydrodipicolinate synthase family protein [Terriglobia bacterium]